MWNLGNRDIIVLVSVLSGCAILCNVWGAFYAIAITLLLAICGWFTIVVADDTPFTPRALLALDYLEEAGREVNAFLETVYIHLHDYSTDISSTVKRLYRIHVVERMAQRRRSTYQLSAETYPSSVNSRFNLVAGLSPISRGTFRPGINSSNAENSPYVEAGSRILERSSSVSKVTSTPMVPWRKEEARNGDISGSEHVTANRSPWMRMGASPQNHTLSRGEDVTYSPEGSPWGTSISPKMRARAGGVKTVQTVAGPLLASTRYNIDPKVYSDVTSPGLTSRLTKYATEANTKLTHQSQYGAGQFPRVNLNSSPTPLINTKTGKMRTPVTVRVAPPENTRYSPPERQKVLSDICHAEVKTAPSVVQVLKEISLKRHASREDVTFELAKKQRTEGVFSDGLENLEEMTQKRARDDSSRSEEEISPQNKSLRPAKRTKMPSCHDILSSLSSSINVSSGVKRKAISRSGTPDLGKHFKSLDSSHSGDAAASPAVPSRTISEPTKSNKRGLNDLDASRSSEVCSPNKKLLESVAPKGILKSQPSKEIVNNASGDAREKWSRGVDEREVRIARENTVGQHQAAVKLTDRLFMKAEPQNIDKLKTLIEEHGSIKPRFVTNESDEIKKSDIVNMRKTSMKTRLKSMFDAISGKAPSAINPEVVIQAEEAIATSGPPITASLSSSTLTTNVNTSPIATTAIVPIIGQTKPSTTPAKHVTFQFSTTDSNAKTDSNESAKPSILQTKLTNNAAEPQVEKKIESPAVAEKSAATISVSQTFNSPSTTTSATSVSTPAFSFATPSLKTSTPAFSFDSSAKPSAPVSSAAFSFGSPSLKTNSSATANVAPTPAAVSTNTTSSVASTAAAATITSTPQFNSAQLSSTSTSIFGNSTTKDPKTSVGTLPNFNNTTYTPPNSQPSLANFLQQGTQSSSMPSQGLTSGPPTNSSLSEIAAKTTAAPPPFSSATTNSFAGGRATSIFSFGGNTPAPTTEKPGGFTGGAEAAKSFGSAVTASQPTTTPVAAAAPTSASGFSFSGSNPAQTKSSIFGTVATTSSAPSSGLPATAANTTAAFTFGSNATATSKPSFSFGSSTTTAAPTATPVSAPASVTFGAMNTNTATSFFGEPANAAQQQPRTFAAPEANAGGFPSSSTTTAASTFGTTSSQPSFAGASNTPSTFGTPKTMETPTFGANGTTASSFFGSAPNTSSIFGGAGNSTNTGANSTATSAAPAATFGTGGFGETKPPPAFGANATPSFTGNSGTSLFGSQPANNPSFGAPNPSATGSTSLFGAPSTTAPTFGAPSTTAPTFGAPNTTAPTFGTPNTTAPTFGTPSTTAPTFGTPSTTAPTFGAPSTAPPAFGATNTTTTTFGAPSTSAPAFGTVGNTSTPAFGQQSSTAGTTTNQNPTSSAFGAVTTAPPAFGTTITSPSGFGTSGTSGFGTPSNPPPAFSSTNSSFSGFGAGSNAASPFGSQPAAAASSTFGAPSSTPSIFGSNPPNNSSFTFGAAQPPAQQPQQSPAVFAFGGASAAPTNNAASGSVPFQFGNTAPQTGGFNFSGAPSTPALNFSRDGAAGGSFATPSLGANAFNAPTTGGMFSIGSGSTGPRTRPSRRRQR